MATSTWGHRHILDGVVEDSIVSRCSSETLLGEPQLRYVDKMQVLCGSAFCSCEQRKEVTIRKLVCASAVEPFR